MDYLPLEHTFVCNMYRRGAVGRRGTYFEVKFDPYGETLSGEVEYGYISPELHCKEYRYRTGFRVGELLPVIETDIISQLVENTKSTEGISSYTMGKTAIDCTRMWLSTQLTHNDVCAEARTILLLALEKMDVKSSPIERYIDMTMSPIEQNPAYTPSDRNAIIRFILAYKDTEVFDVLIFQKDYEKRLLIIDRCYNRLTINLSSVLNYHQSIEMVVNFICR